MAALHTDNAQSMCWPFINQISALVLWCYTYIMKEVAYCICTHTKCPSLIVLAYSVYCCPLNSRLLCDGNKWRASPLANWSCSWSCILLLFLCNALYWQLIHQKQITFIHTSRPLLRSASIFFTCCNFNKSARQMLYIVSCSLWKSKAENCYDWVLCCKVSQAINKMFFFLRKNQLHCEVSITAGGSTPLLFSTVIGLFFWTHLRYLRFCFTFLKSFVAVMQMLQWNTVNCNKHDFDYFIPFYCIYGNQRCILIDFKNTAPS